MRTNSLNPQSMVHKKSAAMPAFHDHPTTGINLLGRDRMQQDGSALSVGTLFDRSRPRLLSGSALPVAKHGFIQVTRGSGLRQPLCDLIRQTVLQRHQASQCKWTGTSDGDLAARSAGRARNDANGVVFVITPCPPPSRSFPCAPDRDTIPQDAALQPTTDLRRSGITGDIP
jgi:hypothetical protein